MIEQPVAHESGLADDLMQYNHNPASTGQRFGNFIVDNLLMNFALSYATGYVVGYMLAAIAPDFLNRLYYDDQFGWFLLNYIVGIFNVLIYYTLCEKLFRGYTLGKLLTGTRALRADGQELTWRDCILRSLSRLVPFEPFSALGGPPWHDTWTKTQVVKVRR